MSDNHRKDLDLSTRIIGVDPVRWTVISLATIPQVVEETISLAQRED